MQNVTTAKETEKRKKEKTKKKKTRKKTHEINAFKSRNL